MNKIWKTTDYLIELIGALGLMLILFLILRHYPRLPDIIPVHWNYLGNPDDFGARSSLFAIPVISIAIYFLVPLALYIESRRTNINLSLKKNKQFIRLTRILKVLVVAFFVNHFYSQCVLITNRDPIIEPLNTLIIPSLIVFFIGGVVYKWFKMA